jgi:hypothetical protein
MVPLHRRLMTNGIVGRFEIAVKASSRYDVHQVAQTVADLQVRAGRMRPGRLVNAGMQMSRLYAKSSTAVALRDHVDDASSVAPGTPLILIERRGLRGDGIATVMDDPDSGVLLEHAWSESSESAPLWVVSHGQESKREAVRQVRVHAMRLHCELQAFTSVLRACLIGQVRPALSKSLKDYMYDSAKRILRPRYNNLPQRGLFAMMSSMHASLTYDLTASIESAFHNVSPSLTRLVVEAADVGRSATENQPDKLVYLNIINSDGGKVIVGDNNVEKYDSIEIGAGAEVRGAVGRNINISDSTFGDSGLDARLEELLNRLVEQLEVLQPLLGEGGSTPVELARMAEQEAQSDEPQPSRIRALMSSILGGVRQVGEAAAPAIQTVEAIQQLVQ